MSKAEPQPQPKKQSSQNVNRRMLVNYYSMLEKNHDEIIQKRREIDDRITQKTTQE